MGSVPAVTTWHLFPDADDPAADVQCERLACGVIVAPGVLGRLTLECPAPPCLSPLNRGEPCVLARGRRGTSCTYCGRPGQKS